MSRDSSYDHNTGIPRDQMGSPSHDRVAVMEPRPEESSWEEEDKQFFSGERTYRLIMRQNPRAARVAVGKEKDRKPVDPPPMVQLIVEPSRDPHQNYLQSPYYFMACTIVDHHLEPEKRKDIPTNDLIGSVVSSLHKLKDSSNLDGGFFIFGDLSARHEGKFRLLFTLYEMRDDLCIQLSSVLSSVFQVYTSKNFPGMSESTFLTRSFSDQGVRLRLRKDSRALATKKRNSSTAQRIEGLYQASRGNHIRQRRTYEQQASPTELAASAVPTTMPYMDQRNGIAASSSYAALNVTASSPMNQGWMPEWPGPQSTFREDGTWTNQLSLPPLPDLTNGVNALGIPPPDGVNGLVAVNGLDGISNREDDLPLHPHDGVNGVNGMHGANGANANGANGAHGANDSHDLNHH